MDRRRRATLPTTFTLNGQHFAIAERSGHKTVYSRMAIEPKLLRRGENKIVLHSDTEHHGIEILLPGPALMVRYQTADETAAPATIQVESVADETAAPTTVQVESAVDESAENLDCFRVTTPNATYFPGQSRRRPVQHD